MKIHRMLQASSDWWEIRRGKVTASNMDKIITAAKGEPSASQEKYIASLLADVAMPTANYFSTRGVFRNQAMQNGADNEAAARRWYELETDTSVQQLGFVESDCGLFGCSPDGVIGLKETPDGATIEGCLELKVPDLDTHIGYLMRGRLPLEYKAQVHGQLIVTGAKWVDFVSYAHSVEALVIRIVPDEFTEKLSRELARFLERYLEAAKKFNISLKRQEAVTPDGEVVTF